MRCGKRVGRSRKKSGRGPTRLSLPKGGRDAREKEGLRERLLSTPADRNDRRVLALIARRSGAWACAFTIPGTALAQAIGSPARKTASAG
jgi:hypothetical protein